VKRLFILVLLVGAGCVPACAQTGVYAEYGVSWYGIPNLNVQSGPTFGLYYQHWGIPFVRVGLDARASFMGSGAAVEDTGLIGPRVQIKPHILPLMPYGEALIGVTHLNVGQGTAHTEGNEFTWALNAGLDLTMLPRFDWRMVDYTYGGIPGNSLQSNPSTVSTGLVVRLP
jgi:hypothetical protein